MTKSTSKSLGAWCVVLGIATACGGDDGGDDGASTVSTGDDSGSSGASSVTMPTSVTVSETADSGSSDGNGTSDSGGDTSSGGTSGDASSTDTGAQGCAALDQMACMADVNCDPILGSPYVMMNDTFCLGPREFIECQDAMVCGDALTNACEGDDAAAYLFPDTCIPTGWIECPAPVKGAQAC